MIRRRLCYLVSTQHAYNDNMRAGICVLDELIIEAVAVLAAGTTKEFFTRTRQAAAVPAAPTSNMIASQLLNLAIASFTVDPYGMILPFVHGLTVIK